MFNQKLILQKKSLKFIKSKLTLNNDEILIKVKSCGICGSDIKILNHGSERVKKNTVLGHEVSGQILNNKKNFISKNNIILGADIPNKLHKDFAIGHEIDGGFQKFLVLKKKILKKIPHLVTRKKINYNVASLSEPLACCLNGFEKVNFKKNKNVIIYGAGPIGYMLAILSLYYKANKIFIVDGNLKRLIIGPSSKKIFKLNLKYYKKKLKSLLKPHEKIDYCFVACNSPKAQKDALKIINKKGTINFFSGLKKNKKKIKVKLDTNLIHYKELSIVGSHGSKKKHLLKAANLIINKKIKLDKIITNVYKINKYNLAFKKSQNGDCLKVIINP